MTRVRAVDLPAVRDQLRAACLTMADGARDPESVRALARYCRRPDFDLWWVTRPMTLLAAHEAQTIPGWDGVAVRPSLAGLLAWETGGGVALPVWGRYGVRPSHIEVAGVVWWSVGERVELAPLVAAERTGALQVGWPGMGILTLVDHVSPACDMEAITAAEMRAADLWATSVTLALQPKVGTIRTGTGPEFRWPDRPRHRSQITVIALRERGLPPMPHDPDREEERKWTLTHRHMVRGHWRQQACGPGRKLRRPVYVVPYIKGPDGADLVETDRVHVWRR